MILVCRLLLLLLATGMCTSTLEAASVTSRMDTLLDAAKDEFGTELNRAETYLLKTVCLGVAADYTSAFQDTRASSPEWKRELTLRADRLEWLCTNRIAIANIPHQGIFLKGAQITGRLNLDFAEVPFPLRFEECLIPDGMDLGNASLQELSLAGTTTGDIAGDGLRIERDLDLSYEFRADGEVRLTNARIGGTLDGSGGYFLNPGPDALFLEGAAISGDLNLRYGFEADGRVSLRNVRIDGNLDCEGGYFRNKTQNAIFAEGISVAGDTFLRDGFEAEGTVDLAGARLGGRLILSGGSFVAAESDAVTLAGSEIKSDVLMREGFVAIGTVNFNNTHILGSIECHEATLDAGTGTAFDGTRLQVDGDITFGGVLTTYSDVEAGRLQIGRVILESAQIAGTFTWNVPEADDRQALDLSFARVGRLWFEANGWPNPGHLELQGLVYDVFYNHRHSGIESLIAWVRLQPTDRFHAQPWEQLASALQKNGQEEEASSILIAKEEDRMRELSPTRQWIHKILGVTIGFGYDPWRAVWIGAVIVLGGAIVFWIGSVGGLIAATKEVEHVYETQDGQPRLSDDYPRFNALVYSLDMFVPLLDLHQANYWLPSSQRGPAVGAGPIGFRMGGILRLYLGIHIYLGWALTTLLAVGLSGLVQS